MMLFQLPKILKNFNGIQGHILLDFTLDTFNCPVHKTRIVHDLQLFHSLLAFLGHIPGSYSLKECHKTKKN